MGLDAGTATLPRIGHRGTQTTTAFRVLPNRNSLPF
jgi:hypothetical protein